MIADMDTTSANRLFPKIGIAVIVHNGKEVLLGLRLKDGAGKGCWQFPGGHLEMYESLEGCSAREIREEVGIEIEDIFFLDLSNNPWPEHNCHYVTLFMVARLKSGTPTVAEDEREKCGEWKWFSIDNLPDPMFESQSIFTPANIQRIKESMVRDDGSHQMPIP